MVWQKHDMTSVAGTSVSVQALYVIDATISVNTGLTHGGSRVHSGAAVTRERYGFKGVAMIHQSSWIELWVCVEADLV